MLGISSKKWISIFFLIATVLISLALSNLSFLISTAKIESFDGYQIPNKGDNAGTSLSEPDVFPPQMNTDVVPMSSSTPVMPGVAISGDFKHRMENPKPPLQYATSSSPSNTATPSVSRTVKPTKSTSIFDTMFGFNEKEQFSTITFF
jgi:hypothetical protein